MILTDVPVLPFVLPANHPLAMQKLCHLHYYDREIKIKRVHLTAGDSSKLLEQFDMGVRLDDGGDIRLAARSVQQGVVVEQTGHVGPLHSW